MSGLHPVSLTPAYPEHLKVALAVAPFTSVPGERAFSYLYKH